MIALIASYAVFIVLLIGAAAFAAGVKVGYRRCKEDTRWDRWILRHQSQRNVKF